MRRRKDEGEEVSLDSLMDTMTNVVGILVLVLVVTQMGVQGAVKRIAETAAVDPAALEALMKQLESLLVDKDDLKKQLEDLNPDESRREEIIKELNTDLSSKQLQLDNLKSQNEFIEAQNKQNQKKLEDIKKYEEEHKKVTDDLNSKMEQIAKLEAILDKTPPRATLPPKVVNIPEPRAAPDGIKPMYMVCYDNQVYPLPNLDEFRKNCRDLAEFIFKRDTRKFVPDPKKGVNAQIFIREYNRSLASKTRDLEYFNVKLINRNNVPHLEFEPKPNQGESVKVVENRSTQFFKAMTRINPQQYYIRFFVVTDSFDVYLSMRALVQNLGILAGWEPQNQDWKYITSLGGPLRFGPPPPPPKPPDPNAPKPKPKPPAPKPKVID